MPSSTELHWIWEYVGLEPVEVEEVFDLSTMRFYQHHMAQEIEEREILLLAAEMGLGKTVAVLTAIVNLKAKNELKRPVLIVAPLLVAKETWPTEIEKWEHTKGLTYSLVVGTKAQRRKALLVKADIHIVNREVLPWLARVWGKKWPYRMLVYDEASRLKGGKKRTASAKRLKKDGTLGVGRRPSGFGVLANRRLVMNRVVELSGTPAPNGLHDLWGPAYILDHGERLGASMTAFDRRWFDFDRYDEYAITPKDHAFDEIMGKLSDVMISMKEEDYLTLPPRIDNPIYVSLPPSLMQAYRKFERTLYLAMHDIEAVSSGVLTNKLLQFANGSVYDEDGSDQFVHDLKLGALESIVEEAAGAPILVAYEFKFDLVALKKRWPKAVIVGDRNWKQRWDRGEIDMLICHPASASHGLNMQFGGSIGVWYGLTWSLELYQQFIKRLHRQGQKADRVWMHHILTHGTIDEDMWATLRTKGVTQDRITDAVRVRLQRAA